jgi:hypothetical protein
MKIDLIAVDLDGTLLNSRKKISPTSLGMIRLVRQQTGVHIVLATARPPRTTVKYHRQLGLDGPMINYNGALVWDTQSGKVLLHQPIPANIARGVVKWARERYPNIRVSAEIGDKWYTDFHDDQYTTETARTHQPDVVGPVMEWLTKPVTKLLLLGEAEWLSQVVWAIKTDIPGQLNTIQTESHLLQIMHSSVSKMEAVKIVANELGMEQQNVMAIGDNANDAGMIQWAGLGVAMANSHHAVLALADHVTESNDADGAARAMRDLVLFAKDPQGQ